MEDKQTLEQNQNNTVEKKKKRKMSEVLRENLQKISIILISFIYIIQGMFQIRQKDTTIWNIIGSIGISIIVGFIISSNLRSMGMRDGRRSDIYINSMISYAKAKEKATPDFDQLSAWCEYKNAQELEFKKKSIIQSAGLNWKAFKLGYYEDEKNRVKLNERQLEALENAKYCQIYRICSQELLSDLPGLSNKSGNRFGDSQKEFLLKRGAVDFLARVLIGIVCGLYGLYPLITGENAMQVISGVIWNTLQIIVFVAFGLLKYNESKSFMEDEYRQTHIVQKTELLNEFVVTIQKNPQVVYTYEEDIEINEYIEEYIAMKQKVKELEEVKEPPKPEEKVKENNQNETNEQEGVLG